MPPLVQLRPRSGGAARGATANSTTPPRPRPLLRYLAGGGLLGSIGDALYQYVPPVHIPVSNVQPAAPVDVSAAWDAADTSGAAASNKALDAARSSFQAKFKDMQIAPFLATEHTNRYMNVLQQEQQRLATDPAAYNNPAVQREVEQSFAQVDPGGSRIMANVNEFKLRQKEYDNLQTKNQLDYVALDQNGDPYDFTYGEHYNDYFTQQDPTKMRRYYPIQYDQNGRSMGGAALNFQMPGTTRPEAQSEFEKVIGSVGTDVSEGGNTTFQEQVPASLAALYQSVGGGAWGVMSTDRKHRYESNVARVQDLIDRIKGQGKHKGNPQLQRILTPATYQQMRAEQYQRIVAQPDEHLLDTLRKAKFAGEKDRGIPLENGDVVPLGRSHLEMRNMLTALAGAGVSANGKPLTQGDMQKLRLVYNTLRRADLGAADDAVANHTISRLGIMQFTKNSDVSTSNLQTGGQKPDASTEKGGDDLYTNLMHASNLEMASPTTQYEEGVDAQGKPVKRDGIGFWSTNVGNVPGFQEIQQSLAYKPTPDGGQTNKTLADLSATGVIYNAFSLHPLTGGNTSTDQTLHDMRVVPGAGQVVYLPRDPSQLTSKRQQLKRDEAEWTNVRNELNSYLERQKKGEKFSAAQQATIQRLAQRENQLHSQATQDGMVPYVRMSAVTHNANLSESKDFRASMKGSQVNLDQVLGRGFMYGSALARQFSPQKDFSGTGLVGIDSNEAQKYGFTDQWGLDDLVKFDVLVPLPNVHMGGNRASQVANSATYTKVQQAEAKQGMSNIAGKGKQHL